MPDYNSKLDQNQRSCGNFGSLESPFHKRYESKFSRDFKGRAVAVGLGVVILVLAYLGLEFRDEHYGHNVTQNNIVYSIPESDKQQ